MDLHYWLLKDGYVPVMKIAVLITDISCGLKNELKNIIQIASYRK
jgi:hypothetical protein